MSGLIARFGQHGMYVLFALSAVMFYMNGIVAAATGWWGLLFPGMLVLSPVMMALLRLGFEGPLDRTFVDPHVMSWSFVVGDFLVLPLALWFAGRGWQGVSVTGAEALMSAFTSGLVGIMAMVVFRKVDGDRYRKVAWESSLKSPTKVWHDCVVMPVVVALLCWLLIPQIISGGSIDTVLAFICLAVFAALVGLDAINEPDPRRQHYRWDTKRFEPTSSL